MRLNLCNPLESRDGTLSKDARMKNLLVENIEGIPTAIKRPGVVGNVEPVTGGLGQGLVSFGGLYYAMVNDELLGPFNPANGWTGWGFGSGYGGAGSAWSPLYEYEEGAEVTHEGDTYTALQGSQGQTPATVSEFWEKSVVPWTRIATTSPFSNYLDGDQIGYVLKSFGPKSMVAFGSYIFSAVCEVVDGGQWEPKIYRSSDGVSWSKVADIPYTPAGEPEWNPDAGEHMHQLVPHGGYLYLLSKLYSGVSYRSSDGVNWTRLLNIFWTNKGFNSISWNGFIWSIFEGTNSIIYKIADASSGDGSTASFSGKRIDNLFVYGANLYAIHQTGMLVTTDGITWNDFVPTTQLPATYLLNTLNVGGVIHAYGTPQAGVSLLTDYIFNGTTWVTNSTHTTGTGFMHTPVAYFSGVPYIAVVDFTTIYSPVEMWQAVS